MKQQQPAQPATDSTKCRFHTASGRRCRLPVVDSRSALCFRHSALRNLEPDTADLSSDFAGLLTDPQSAVQINNFLARLISLTIQHRISPRRAAALAYMGNLLIRTLRPVDRELHGDPDEEPQIICDIPGPDRTGAPEEQVSQKERPQAFHDTPWLRELQTTSQVK